MIWISPFVDVDPPVYRLDVMSQDDVPDVSRVERRCFSNPWPVSAYRRELQNPAQNYYVVLREVEPNDSHHSPFAPLHDLERADGPGARPLPRRSLLPLTLGRRQDANGAEKGQTIGFGGMWFAFDEAHITTLGVAPEYRGRGLGELILLSLIDEAIARGASWLTLEVRVSNLSAQSLYRKYQFTEQGTRKRYYSDNNEDALIMWSPSLRDADFRGVIEARRQRMADRLAHSVLPSGSSPLSGRLSWAKSR
jgi:ribosomal-protein-alanine N-acetyltransferase